MNEEAVRAIFAAKGRPADNPLIVHVANMNAVQEIAYVSDRAKEMLTLFCPGPLTLLLPKKDCIPPVVNAGLPSVAVRIPSHPVAQAMLKACELPIAAPSANTSGKPSPTKAEHVLHDLNGKVPLILDGGECQVGLESTVLDLTSEIPTVLRPGGVTPEMLLTVLPELKIADSVLRPLKEGEKALSPGMMYKHYAPQGQLTMVKGEASIVAAYCCEQYRQAQSKGKRCEILAFEEHRSFYDIPFVSLGSLSHPEIAAHRLFAILREADDIELLYSEVLPPKGVGLAVMNRLSRAAAFHEIDLSK